VPSVLRLDYGDNRAAWRVTILRGAAGLVKRPSTQPLSLDSCVSTLLGHAKLSTAQIYFRVSVGRMMQPYRPAQPHARVA